MEITAGITAYYYDTRNKRWVQIDDLSDVEYITGEGYEIDHELYICAVTNDGAPFEDRVLKTRRFKKKGTSCQNISLLHHVFQYNESTGDVIYLNKIITV